MNKLWLFCIILTIALPSFSLSAYDQGIRKDRAHRKQYRVQIGELQQETENLQNKNGFLQQEVSLQQVESINDKKIIANLKQENYILKQERNRLLQYNQKMLLMLNADCTDTALKKINHLMTVHDHAKNIAKHVHVITKASK